MIAKKSIFVPKASVKCMSCLNKLLKRTELKTWHNCSTNVLESFRTVFDSKYLAPKLAVPGARPRLGKLRRLYIENGLIGLLQRFRPFISRPGRMQRSLDIKVAAKHLSARTGQMTGMVPKH